MLPPSLRFRLPLSYALIALLSALVLGAGLLGLLRGYYRQEEARYLRTSAETIGRALAPHLALSAPAGALQSQLEGIAFLTQTRVRLTDAAGAVLADSGAADAAGPVTLAIQVTVGDVTQAFSQTLTGGPAGTGYHSFIVVQGEGLSLQDGTAFEAGGLVSQLPVVRTPFGVALGQGESPAVSDETLRWPITREASRDVLGYVELSEGPAYGRAIVGRVAAGWAAASLLAVVLAGAVGWRISRGVIQPLLALSQVATRMAAGDFTARAAAGRRDELGTLAAAFNGMAARLATQLTTLRQFVTDAAHALNTPLTVLQSDLALMAEPLTDPTQLERVQRVRGQMGRLAELAGQLLDLARAEAGSGELGVVDLRALVQAASELYASSAEQKGVTLWLALPAQPLPVPGDERQLRLAVVNVLDNAVKFTPAGGRIEVRLSAAPGGADLNVCDTGPGMAADDLPLVFDRFRRGRGAAGLPGSGLGLAIVKAVLAAHGGTVNIASGAGGTCVRMALPAGENG